MTDLSVSVWRKYGKHRLYVSQPDGSRVGWVDVLTGQVVLEVPELKAAFDRAVAGHEQRSERPKRADTPANVPDQGPWSIRIDWRDVGSNEAGQALREQAKAERKAAPVRSLAARLLGVHTDERAWRVGAQGEAHVAARLARLPGQWQVIHSIEVGTRGSDIDHVVMGPGGVFTLNAKHHPDAKIWVGGNTFMVNGQRHPYVRNARHEAQRASRLLSAAVGFAVHVQGVIAVVGARRGFTVKQQPEDVQIVARKQIVRWLLDRPPVLDAAAIQAIHAAARRSTTWR